jgi:hypothetical protein
MSDWLKQYWCQMCFSVILAMAAVPTQSQAKDKGFTAAVLYDECTNHPPSSVQRAHCNGFIHGFLVGTMTTSEIAKLTPPFCGGDPEVSALVTVFQTAVRMRPQLLSLDANVALVAAFTTAFPCGTK